MDDHGIIAEHAAAQEAKSEAVRPQERISASLVVLRGIGDEHVVSPHNQVRSVFAATSGSD